MFQGREYFLCICLLHKVDKPHRGTCFSTKLPSKSLRWANHAISSIYNDYCTLWAKELSLSLLTSSASALFFSDSSLRSYTSSAFSIISCFFFKKSFTTSCSNFNSLKSLLLSVGPSSSMPGAGKSRFCDPTHDRATVSLLRSHPITHWLLRSLFHYPTSLRHLGKSGSSSINFPPSLRSLIVLPLGAPPGHCTVHGQPSASSSNDTDTGNSGLLGIQATKSSLYLDVRSSTGTFSHVVAVVWGSHTFL